MDRSIALAIGQTHHLKTGKDRITYAGMPSDEVYSIIQRKTAGYHGFAWNLYYPKRKREITIDGMSLHVDSVTPEEIRFRVL